MKAEPGIISFGAYVPRKRLQRAAIHSANAWFAPGLKGLARGERAIADWDEDTITMAVEAARDTLAGFDRATVTALSLASTTLPFADRLNAGVVKEALTLPDRVAALDATGSLRAATSQLLLALGAARDGEARHLCLAGDRRKARPASEAEMVQGDAAAGLLIGTGDVVARFLGSHSLTIDFVDHYRSSGSDFDYGWESRWVRDEGYVGMIGTALAEALAGLGVTGQAIDRFVVPITAKGVSEALAKKAGIRAEAVADTLSATIGDSGAAHPFLMLAATLDAAGPGEKVLLLGFGQGVDVLLFETTEAIARLPKRAGMDEAVSHGFKDGNYMRYLSHRGLVELERGMRAEIDQKQPGSTLFRHRKTVLGLVGGRCTKTGTVQFPRSEIGVHPGERAIGTQEDYPLAERTARIVSYTADSLTYSPAPPTYYGMIDFDGGGRMVAEFADTEGEEIVVGRAMRMRFRIKAIDEMRDFTRYFWKAAPVG